jgi:molecular chaperone DnaJ
VAYRDLYNVLGVPRNASQDDIKKAYRKLAMQWHPDRTGNDPAGEQRFKDLTLAYKVLSDADERARYDRLGPLYTPDGRPPRPEDLEETLTGVLGRWFGVGKPKKGEDLRYTLSLDLEEVAKGTTRQIRVPRKVRCATCQGDGATPQGKVTCTVCNGTGKATGRLLRTSCYHCDGRGYTIAQSCPDCSGEGRVSLEDLVEVPVPPGSGTGQKLKIGQKGDAGPGQGPEGDLYVVVHVAEHPLFRRRGDDLLVDVPVTFAELALGAEVQVPTVEGRTSVKVPAGTPPGRILRLSGRGLPKFGGGPRGDLHLQVLLDVPEELNPAQRSSLEAWARALPPQAHPRRHAFDELVKQR